MAPLLFARGDDLWEITYEGGKSFTTRTGADGRLGRRAVEAFGTKGDALRAANAEIARREEQRFAPFDPGRLRSNVPGARWVSLETAKAILKTARAPKAWHRRAAHAEYLLEEGVLLHRGDLRVEKLAVGPNPLVVAGDLVVRKVLFDERKADETALVVLGDLDVRDCATFSTMLVAGDARIRGTLYGFSAHDHVFSVGGRLTADAVIDGDHWFEAHRPSRIALLVGDRGCLLGKVRARRTAEPHEALKKGSWKWLEPGLSSVERYRVARLVCAGKPVLARR